MESEPGLPTFFSTSFFVPSGRVNSTAVMSPSTSLPVQVAVVVNDGVPVDGESVMPVHSGGVLLDIGVGVGVAVGPGVLVGVGPGVTVGDGPGVTVGLGPGVLVGVGLTLGVMANTNLQFVRFTAFGVTCGTVGATDCWFSSLVEVKYATIPMPTVRKVTNSKYQYFLKKLRGYFHTPSTNTSASI